MENQKVLKTSYIMVKMEPELKLELDMVAKEKQYGSTAEFVRRVIIEKIQSYKQAV